MAKEELEHNHIKEIAEKYVYECWGTYLDLDEVDLVSAGIGVAKIISKEKDGHIAELEKENAELQQQCLILADCNTCTSACKTENIEMEKQLTKAKEIMQKLIANAPDTYSGTNIELQQKKMFSFQDAVNKAEQFIKDSEVEK